MTSETYTAIQAYLTRLGLAEYQAGMAQHIKRGRKAKTYRHNPSQYHRDLVEALGRDDEEAFKALKLEQGYASDLGV
jgi:hypothetical protein